MEVWPWRNLPAMLVHLHGEVSINSFWWVGEQHFNIYRLLFLIFIPHAVNACMHLCKWHAQKLQNFRVFDEHLYLNNDIDNLCIYLYIYICMFNFPHAPWYTCILICHLYHGCPCSLQEKCCDIIDFAAAELRDVKDGFHTAMSCPVLSALATADRRKAAPGINCGTLFFNGPNNVHLGYAGFTLNICFEYIP